MKKLRMAFHGVGSTFSSICSAASMTLSEAVGARVAGPLLASTFLGLAISCLVSADAAALGLCLRVGLRGLMSGS